MVSRNKIHDTNFAAWIRSLSVSMFLLLCFVSPLHAQTPMQPAPLTAALSLPDAPLPANDTPPAPAPPVSNPAAAPDATPVPNVTTATLTGTVTDPIEAVIVGATVSLHFLSPAIASSKSSSASPATALPPTSVPDRTALTDAQGSFRFPDLAPGTYSLLVQAKGFATAITPPLLLHPGELATAPTILLQITTAASTVHVSALTQVELAQQEIHAEEKQRFLYIAPNFFVTYLPHPVPLTAKQKMSLAFRDTIDPYTFIAVGAIAGAQQALNVYKGYGQEAGGYAKRYGANYGNVVAGDIIGAGLMPALLRQDPRYFYKGTGTVRSRIVYALLTIVRTKGDNGHWQPNYSGITGDLAATEVSNSYLPAGDKLDTVGVINSALIGFAFQGIFALEQEFLLRHLTTHSSAPGTVGH